MTTSRVSSSDDLYPISNRPSAPTCFRVSSSDDVYPIVFTGDCVSGTKPCQHQISAYHMNDYDRSLILQYEYRADCFLGVFSLAFLLVQVTMWHRFKMFSPLTRWIQRPGISNKCQRSTTVEERTIIRPQLAAISSREWSDIVLIPASAVPIQFLILTSLCLYVVINLLINMRTCDYYRE